MHADTAKLHWSPTPPISSSTGDNVTSTTTDSQKNEAAGMSSEASNIPETSSTDLKSLSESGYDLVEVPSHSEEFDPDCVISGENLRDLEDSSEETD